MKLTQYDSTINKNISNAKINPITDPNAYGANVTGTEAIEFINNIFGSTDRLKEVVIDIIENHQKYLFHSYASNVNCLEVSNVYAYYEYSREEYNLQYNVSYYTTNVNLMVFSSDIGLENNFNLSDFDKMYPWQRDLYLMLIKDKYKQRIDALNKKNNTQMILYFQVFTFMQMCYIIYTYLNKECLK